MHIRFAPAPPHHRLHRKRKRGKNKEEDRGKKRGEEETAMNR
jgi:hypothetical protein